jgi:superfamily I DNA and/or RNA helicase
MIEKIPIIVTTCKAAKSNVFQDMHFSKVIIDEAT